MSQEFDILKNQAAINRLIYQQKIADQESQPSSAKYAGYDATVGMTRVIDAEGNIKYVKPITTGGVGRDSQIRVRGGDFGSYDATPFRRVEQVEEIVQETIVKYLVKTLFRLFSGTTDFYLGGDRKQIKVKPSELSLIAQDLNYGLIPGMNGITYTQGFVINLGGNKAHYFIFDYEKYISITNDQLTLLEPSDPPPIYLGNGVWEKGYLGIIYYSDIPEKRITVAESSVQEYPIAITPTAHKGVNYPTNQITSICYNGSLNYQESFKTDDTKIYGKRLSYNDAYVYINPEGEVDFNPPFNLNSSQLAAAGWDIRISKVSLVSISQTLGLTDDFSAIFNVDYNGSTKAIRVSTNSQYFADYYDITDPGNIIYLGNAIFFQPERANYLFSIGWEIENRKLSNFISALTSAGFTVSDNSGFMVEDRSDLIPLISAGEKDFNSYTILALIPDRKSTTEAPTLIFNEGYFKENVETLSQLILKDDVDEFGDPVQYLALETKNIDVVISLITESEAKIINSNDFLCASRTTTNNAEATSVYPGVSSFMAVFGTENITEFDPDYLVGMDVIYSLFNAYVKGTITSADFEEIYDDPFNSGRLILNINMNEYVSDKPLSFSYSLITDNGSYYAYHFRNYNRSSNFAYNFQNQFICKQSRPSLSLSPLSKSIIYESDDERVAFLLAKTDNLVGNKIYSVVQSVNPLTTKEIWVEQWDILDDGRIKFNRVFKEKYYKLSKSDGQGINIYSHNYHP